MTNSVSKTLGDHLVKVATWNPLREAVDREFSYVDLSAVDNQRKQITEWQTLVGGDAPSRARQIVRSGDVLVSTVRPNLNGVARVPKELDGATASTGFCVLRADPRRLSSEYLFQWVRTPEFVDAMVQQATGASYPAVSDRIIFASQIPLPSLFEQRRIAAILDQADELRRKRQSGLKLLDHLTRTFFVELFGDPANSESRWPKIALQDFFRFRTGKLDSNAAVPSGEYPFFTCAKEDSWIDKFAFDCEALLLAGNNANADYSVKHYIGKFNAYQRTYVITLIDDANSYHYARFALEYRLLDLKKISKGTNTKYLTLDLLNKIRIPLPPVEVQEEFAFRAGQIAELRSTQGNHLSKVDALFASLQHRAFSGELTSKQAERELAMAG